MDDTDSMGDMDMSSHMMQMYFYSSTTVTVLFSWWTTVNWWQYLLTLIFWFLAAIFYEWLAHFAKMQDLKVKVASESPTGKSYDVNSRLDGYADKRARIQAAFSARVIPSLLYTVRIFLSYMLMLVSMTYNVGLVAAIVLGAGAGHFLFYYGFDELRGKTLGEYMVLDDDDAVCH
mmetsp:Transcript_3853/g.10642  ORF Transcript_3853/g.10642 Transcript_3853/m.10642 type:complete len:175 (-) Transcript_3853:97-621(-)|eukprot:CAMPEP_0119126582 /NCGR_PEP_ID=MMETSP1310-20130426/5458_1 /TAXON_ID=464262 /ORGANISM="Genus nov. species nov., Strain RCC2339" /LENGTH=174 /DNA_ID=CAMNT_0007116751 /DNA_START=229 /DNA_END=753 /DNA_ORIENTATION=+